MDGIYYPVGTRVIVTEDYDDALEGMIGTVCVGKATSGWNTGFQGVVFDEKFSGGHDLDGNCEYGYGQWVPPEKLAALDDDKTSISCDEEVRFY